MIPGPLVNAWDLLGSDVLYITGRIGGHVIITEKFLEHSHQLIKCSLLAVTNYDYILRKGSLHLSLRLPFHYVFGHSVKLKNTRNSQ